MVAPLTVHQLSGASATKAAWCRPPPSTVCHLWPPCLSPWVVLVNPHLLPASARWINLLLIGTVLTNTCRRSELGQIFDAHYPALDDYLWMVKLTRHSKGPDWSTQLDFKKAMIGQLYHIFKNFIFAERRKLKFNFSLGDGILQWEEKEGELEWFYAKMQLHSKKCEEPEGARRTSGPAGPLDF